MAKQTVNQSLSSEDLTNIDDLSKKSAQLDALMYMTYGEAVKCFAGARTRFKRTIFGHVPKLHPRSEPYPKSSPWRNGPHIPALGPN